MGLGEAYMLKGDFKVIIWGQATKVGTTFYGGIDPRDKQRFSFGLGWKIWLKMRHRKVLNFMQLFLHYISFGENFIG